MKRLIIPIFLLLLSTLLHCQNLLSVAGFETAIFKITNQYRAKYQLPPLLPDEGLSVLARRHARNMSRYNFFSHKDRENLQVDGRQRKYYPQMMVYSIGENLAYHQNYERKYSPAQVVEGWMNSPEHRDNILSPDYSHLGVGVLLLEDELYLVQNFAYPVVKMLTPPLREYSLKQSYPVHFQYVAVEPRETFAAYLILPNKDTKVMLSPKTYALGIKPLQITWEEGSVFKLELPFDYGKGLYRLAFGWNNGHFPSDFKFQVK